MDVNAKDFNTEEYFEWLKEHDAAKDDKPSYAVHSSSLDALIKCKNCGKVIRYGDSYRSSNWLYGGMGFMVCRECKEAELGRRLK